MKGRYGCFIINKSPRDRQWYLQIACGGTQAYPHRTGELKEGDPK